MPLGQAPRAPQRSLAASPHQAVTGLIAPLLFARFAIMVTVHLRVWTMLEKVPGFGARGHLRAPGTTVALEALDRCGCGSLCGVFCRSYGMTRCEGCVAIGADDTDGEQAEDRGT